MNKKYSIATDDIQVLSVREARAQFSTMIDTAQEGVPSIVTRHSQPVAMIIPIEKSKNKKTSALSTQKKLDQAFGMWKNRNEQSSELARILRDLANRYGKIFS